MIYDKASLERMTLDVLEYRLTEAISADNLACACRVNVRQALESVTGSLILEVRLFLAGKTVPDGTTVIRHPAGCWQWFKLLWFPTWAKRRWPVRFTDHVVQAVTYRVCPHIRVPADTHGIRTHLDFIVAKGDNDGPR